MIAAHRGRLGNGVDNKRCEFTLSQNRFRHRRRRRFCFCHGEGKAISGLCSRPWRVTASTSFFIALLTMLMRGRTHACAKPSFLSLPREKEKERGKRGKGRKKIHAFLLFRSIVSFLEL